MKIPCSLLSLRPENYYLSESVFFYLSYDATLGVACIYSLMWRHQIGTLCATARRCVDYPYQGTNCLSRASLYLDTLPCNNPKVMAASNTPAAFTVAQACWNQRYNGCLLRLGLGYPEESEAYNSPNCLLLVRNR